MGYTMRIESQEKKNEYLAKVTMSKRRRKTIGSVCNIILMKSCHERIGGTSGVWSSKWIL